MPVLINFKICDNCADCNGIRVCPVGAFHWDEENRSIAVDKEKCMGCEACVGACPVSTITIEDGVAKVGDDCIECGACVGECPAEAISL